MPLCNASKHCYKKLDEGSIVSSHLRDVDMGRLLSLLLLKRTSQAGCKWERKHNVDQIGEMLLKTWTTTA